MSISLEGHFQNAYVTRDLDAAVALLRTQHGIDSFKSFEAKIEVRTPAGQGTAVTKVALGWAGNLQYELIEPVSGLVDVYRDALPESGTLGFHHICMRTYDWDGLRAEIDRQRRPIVLEGGTEGRLKFLYVDARDSLGHYLEYVWMTPEHWTLFTGR